MSVGLWNFYNAGGIIFLPLRVFLPPSLLTMRTHHHYDSSRTVSSYEAGSIGSYSFAAAAVPPPPPAPLTRRGWWWRGSFLGCCGGGACICCGGGACICGGGIGGPGLRYPPPPPHCGGTPCVCWKCSGGRKCWCCWCCGCCWWYRGC